MDPAPVRASISLTAKEGVRKNHNLVLNSNSVQFCKKLFLIVLLLSAGIFHVSALDGSGQSPSGIDDRRQRLLLGKRSAVTVCTAASDSPGMRRRSRCGCLVVRFI